MFDLDWTSFLEGGSRVDKDFYQFLKNEIDEDPDRMKFSKMMFKILENDSIRNAYLNKSSHFLNSMFAEKYTRRQYDSTMFQIF